VDLIRHKILSADVYATGAIVSQAPYGESIVACAGVAVSIDHVNIASVGVDGRVINAAEQAVYRAKLWRGLITISRCHRKTT